MFCALFSPWFSVKHCSNNFNQMLGAKRIREENRLLHIVKQAQNLLVVGRFASLFLLVVGKFRSF